MSDFSIDRRRLMVGSAVAGIGALASVAITPQAVYAAASQAGTLIQGVYRRRLGDFEITAMSDGYIDVADEFWTGIDAETLRMRVREAFLPEDGKIRIGVTSYLINTGEQLVLVDTGSADWFGPTAGRFRQSLAGAGVAPEDVDVVLITHMHPDHTGALIDGGQAVFPKATVHICETDYGYWSSNKEEANAPDFAKPWFDAARKVGRAYGERMQLFSGGPEMTPGITAMPLVGHTPGHTGFLVESAGERLLIWGDMCGVAAVQFRNPEAGLVFDVDGDTGKRTRRRGLEMAADDRLLIASAHLPFPSFGHVDRLTDGFAWVAEEWRYDLAS